MTQEEYEAAFPDKQIGDFVGSWKNEILSDALAVHSSEAKKHEEIARKIGVPTEYKPDGRPVIRSTAHRRALLKAIRQNLGAPVRERNEYY